MQNDKATVMTAITRIMKDATEETLEFVYFYLIECARTGA